MEKETTHYIIPTGSNQREDQWSYKCSPECWPGITTKMKKVAIASSFYLNKTKQDIYVEDNVIKMFEKYQLHPPYGF